MTAGDEMDLTALTTFDRHGDRLYDLAHAITRDHAAAAEVVRDVVAAADGEIGDRPALYARVRGAAFDSLADRGRLPPEERVIELPELADAPTPADLGAIVWAALGAYSERDQALLTLHLRHGADGEALADAMGVAEGAAAPLLARAQERVREEIGALLALIGVAGPAAGRALAEVEQWDGTFSPWVRRRVAARLREEGAALPDPLPLLQVVPLVPAPPAVREAVATRVEALRGMGAAASVEPHPHDLDDTLPPGAQLPLGGEDDPTIPPEHAIPLVVPGEPPAGPVATSPPSPPPLPDPTEDAATAATGDLSRGSAPRRRVPLALSIALGAAAALVVAAGITRIVVDDPVEPEPSELSLVEVPEIPTPAPFPIGRTPRPPTSSGVAPAADPTAPAGAAGASGAPEVPVALSAPPDDGGDGSDGAAPAESDPGRLVTPGGAIEVPASGTTLPLRNAGAQPLEWRIEALPDWADASPIAGTLAPGAVVELRVALVEGTAEGDHRGSLVVRADGQPEASEVVVTASVDRPPEPTAVQFGTRLLFEAGCGLDSTEVAVNVTDESGLDEVVLTVTGPAPNTQTQVVLTPDPAQPDRFIGVVGPFRSAGSADVLVTATDTRGNSASADGGTLTIAPCPGGA